MAKKQVWKYYIQPTIKTFKTLKLSVLVTYNKGVLESFHLYISFNEIHFLLSIIKI